MVKNSIFYRNLVITISIFFNKLNIFTEYITFLKAEAFNRYIGNFIYLFLCAISLQEMGD